MAAYIDCCSNERIRAKTKWMPSVKYRMASTCYFMTGWLIYGVQLPSMSCWTSYAQRALSFSRSDRSLHLRLPLLLLLPGQA